MILGPSLQPPKDTSFVECGDGPSALSKIGSNVAISTRYMHANFQGLVIRYNLRLVSTGLLASFCSEDPILMMMRV